MFELVSPSSHGNRGREEFLLAQEIKKVQANCSDMVRYRLRAECFVAEFHQFQLIEVKGYTTI